MSAIVKPPTSAQQRVQIKWLETEIERLRAIETAARRFVTEAEDYPRYAPVKVWATPEADPYLNLRKALGDQQKQDGSKE